MKKTPAKDKNTGGPEAETKAGTVNGKPASAEKNPGKFEPRKLTAEEQKSLDDLEQTVSTKLTNVLELGKALKAINDQELYKASCETFEKYCVTRWGMSRSYAYRHINAADCIETLKKELVPQGVSIFPINESQVRLLIDRVKRPRWADTWKKVVAKADGKVVTAAMVLKVIPKKRGKRDSDLRNKTGPESAKETPEQCLTAVADLVKKARQTSTGLSIEYYKQLLDDIWGKLHKHCE